MAAPLIVRHLELFAALRSRAAVCVRKRALHNSTPLCAGQEWRIRNGFARSNSEYGPLTDLPDWSFADGRPAPTWKGHLRRKEEREALTRRVILLSTEMEAGLTNWREKQQALEEEHVQKKKMQLKPKAIFKKKAECH
ncbi:39S ribosomal protein L52, mitochondrial [Spea bombifrons]|uniref:39S ribosomal protein L52, mitochondrial n=1 Tax=Spea bombifrons TaxID=233779 RepID=UPI00234AAD66|nr:39S ribosomal protein L52, mitochondrial [Spea bombifrons]